MQKEQTRDRSVNGYCFTTKEDAGLAMQEKEKAIYLEKRMDYRNPRNVMSIYDKAIETRTFRTPVGLEYLKRLQNFLDQTTLRDEVQDIPIYQNYVLVEKKEPVEAKRRVRSNPLKVLQRKYRLSLLLNGALAAAVIAMFVIALSGENANIINYRSAVVNEYSEWEQELTERENAVRERERELKLQEP